MTRTTTELLRQHDVDPVVVEAILSRYGADLEEPSVDNVSDPAERAYAFLDGEDGSPIRTVQDHYYQFATADHIEGPPETESAFGAVLEELVDEGLVARTAELTPRYSVSFYDLLADVRTDWTASGVDEFCAETGVNKREVYAHIFTDLHLDVDLTE
ncbi:hypothetical protein GCM10027435_04090 [Haloparvum alkalitolerans]|uniref:hypothetical protein n=1 Tax=Haloparvum alkalitolerans TaxID=1042953 RepID=UPI003CE9A2B4